MDEKKLIVADIAQQGDILQLNEFISLVAEIVQAGWGEASMKVTVQNGRIKVVSLSKTKTVSVDHLNNHG